MVSLDVTELEFIIREDVGHTVLTGNSIDATKAQITCLCLCMVVNEHSNVSKLKILRQEVLVVGVALRVNIRLEGGDNVGILGGSDCFEEHGRAIAGVEEDLFFGLETEIELVALTKFQDVGIVIPAGLLEGYGGIKRRNSEFQNTPK